MSNFAPCVEVAPALVRVRNYVLAEWGGRDSGSKGDSRHCPDFSGHNAKCGGCNGPHEFYVVAWDWGHDYLEGYRDVVMAFLMDPASDYAILDGYVWRGPHRTGTGKPERGEFIGGHTWHAHLQIYPSAVNNTIVLGGTPVEENALDIGGLTVADVTRKEIIGWFRNRDRHIDRRFREQNDRNAIFFGMVLDAAKGGGDLEEFKEALEQDRANRIEEDRELREGLAEDVKEIIADLDAIDGVPADEIAQAVADQLAARLVD